MEANIVALLRGKLYYFLLFIRGLYFFIVFTIYHLNHQTQIIYTSPK